MERRAYHHGDLANALINAAGSVLEREGVAAITLRGAAVAAGVSPAAPYRHFADKEALLAAVAARGFDELTRACTEGLEGSKTPLTGLKKAALAWVRFARAHPAVYQLMSAPNPDKAGHPELLKAAQGAPKVLLAGIEAAQAAEALAPDEPPTALAQTLVALVHGLSSLGVEGLVGLETIDVAATRAIEHLLEGVGKR